MTSPGYEKLKRHRRRKRSGLIVLAVEVDASALTDVLIEAGYLATWDEGDRDKLRAGLEHAIGVWSQP
jgi:hypothetical protein